MEIYEEVEAFILSFLTLELYGDEWSALQSGRFIPEEMVPITTEYPVMAPTNAHICTKISVYRKQTLTSFGQLRGHRQEYKIKG
jgi:hypothetical protein